MSFKFIAFIASLMVSKATALVPFSSVSSFSSLVGVGSCSDVKSEAACETASFGGASCTWCSSSCVPSASFSTSNIIPVTPSTYAASLFVPTGVNACGVPASSCRVLLLGPGTAMNSKSYNQLFSAIASLGYIAAVVDHQPESLFKLDDARFASAIQLTQQALPGWVNQTDNYAACDGKFTYLIGGHSASGQSAAETFVKNPNIAEGFFSLDPFNCASVPNTVLFNGPSLIWSLVDTTCFVTVANAGLNCYQRLAAPTKFHSALIQLNNTVVKYAHCDFTDNGCGLFCSAGVGANLPDLHTAVALSYHRFSNSIDSGEWNEADLNPPSTNKTPVNIITNFNTTTF